jgi:tetratricopeptide (TPR) repeat protein
MILVQSLAMDMVLIKLGCGIILLALGLIYLFQPAIVLSINNFVRTVVFDDRIILLSRKKLSTLFFCLSFIILYMGFSSFSQHIAQNETTWRQTEVHFLMYQALQNYADQHVDKALQKYRTVLSIDPANIEAMKRMAAIYDLKGNLQEGRSLRKKALRLNPTDKELLQKLTTHEKS